VAITVFDEHDRQRLVDLTGEDIAAWTAARSDIEAAQALQAIGIAAGAVQDCGDMIDSDPQLAARGSLVELDHPLLGAFGHIATPIRFSFDTLAPYRAPRMGEHSREVARDLCGLNEDLVADLEAKGVFK
jgi:crotonobetainyl-CoA:carnitine CoA-transferase CaiB-like acyl-CoA transferase